MELAFSIGISIAEFWEITPYELRVAARGYTKRKELEAKEYQAKFKNERDLAIYQAYLISRWVWAKEIDIEKILSNENPKSKKMTNEQMLAQIRIINAMCGGEVKENV